MKLELISTESRSAEIRRLGQLYFYFIVFYQSSRQEGVFDDNVSYFSLKPYVVTCHLNCLVETGQMRGHNIYVYEVYTKISVIITKYSLLSRALFIF